MSNKTIRVRITNEELFALGFERVIYNGKEYVDKSPLFLDSTCPLSQAYHQLAAKKANRAKLMEETMKKNQIRKSVAALAMAVVVGVSLLGYGCGSKSASTAGGVSGDFTGTAKGMGGDVTVTLTLEDGKITGCTAEGKDETPGIGTLALEQLPAQIAETGSIAVDGVSTATITSNAIKEAAAAALTAAGLNADDYKIEVKADETKAEDSTVDADVVIVGAGGAGMTAAITAAAEGKSVVIVESQAMVGGNSVRATGGMNAGKTVYQDENEFGESAGVEKTLKTAAEKYADNETITALAKTVSEQWAEYQKNPTGYFDSVELMELDTMIGGKGINDPALVETLCSNSADAIDWLDEHGITLHSVSSFGGASVKRIHRPVDAEGKTVSVGSYMIPLLEENCEKAGAAPSPSGRRSAPFGSPPRGGGRGSQCRT